MSKRNLWILTISLILAMMGLIIVQINWIKNAFELNDRQFIQLVNTTLSDVSRQIEHYYISKGMNSVIEEEIEPETEINWNVVIESLNDPVIHTGADNEAELDPPIKSQTKNDELAEIIGDTIIVITHTGENRIDTINITSYQDEMKLKNQEAALKMKKEIINKVLLDDVSFKERVNKKDFEDILKNNILSHGIDLNFEYTVIKNNKQEIFKSESFDKNTDYYYYKAGLMNDKILDNDTYLYLYFPGQKEHIRQSMGFLGLSTVILTSMMILLFSYALYVIFKQKKLSDIKNDFVNNMTHELKTPISTISLASQMLNDESIPMEKKNTRHISKIIQTESKRLGYQVERVLQMAVLDQGHLILKKVPVGMKEIITTVCQNFKLQIESLNGKLDIIEEAENDIVFGDKVHLMNVVTNLMDNAVKYSKDKPHIKVRIYTTNNYFNLSIEDNGIGINKENQKKIFEKFYRVSTGNVHDVKGFGLGLSYVKLIVDQHGGIINLSSELNKGTKFVVKLPMYIEKQTI